MSHGLDTSFLVAVEVAGHPGHAEARSFLNRVLDGEEGIALAPQVLAEFIHVVTDARRFQRPLTVAQARERAERWCSREAPHHRTARRPDGVQR